MPTSNTQMHGKENMKLYDHGHKAFRGFTRRNARVRGCVV